jgi:toxin FitB
VRTWILDTNVLSELRRNKPDSSVQNWMKEARLAALCTTAMNIAELRLGISNQDSAADAHRLTIWLEETIRPWFRDKTLNVTENALFIWRSLSRELEKKRLPAPAVDLMIAAVALDSGTGVATRDIKPFIATGVPVINPWTGERYNGA